MTAVCVSRKKKKTGPLLLQGLHKASVFQWEKALD